MICTKCYVHHPVCINDAGPGVVVGALLRY